MQSYLSAAGITMNLGDVNGDGITNQIAGNMIVSDTPDVEYSNGFVDVVDASYRYNSFGQLISETDNEDHVTDYQYYSSGNQTGYLESVTSDVGSGTDPVTSKDYLNITESFSYDDRGNMISSTDGEGNVASFVYNELDQIVESTSPAPFNYKQRFFYNANNKLVRHDVQNVAAHPSDPTQAGMVDVSNPWLSTLYEYDILENKIAEKKEETGDNADATSVTNMTDGIVSTIDTAYAYTLNEELQTVTNPEGKNVRMEYDERNKLFRRYMAFGTADQTMTQYNYDDNGNVIEVVDGNGNLTDIVYDGYDRMEGVIDALGNIAEFSYDNASNILGMAAYEGQGINTTRQFNTAGLNKLIQSSMKYDERGRDV